MINWSLVLNWLPLRHARLACPRHILCWLAHPVFLLVYLCQAWILKPSWPHQELLLCAPKLGVNVLALMLLLLALIIPASLAFRPPNLKVDNKILTEVDSHSEIHDSLINSTLESFNFNLNLSSVSFGASIFILILIILLTRRQNLAIARISGQLFLQKKKIEMLLKWRTETYLTTEGVPAKN